MQNWLILSLLASICWGLQYSSYGAKLGKIPVEQYAFIYFSCITVIYGVFILIRRPTFVTLDASEIGWLMVNIILGAIGSILIAMSIQSKDATVASLVEISYPFFVMLFGTLLFKEKFPETKAILGSIMIFSGIFLISKS